MKNIILFFNANFPIVHPANPLRIFWTFIHLACIVFLAVSIPFIMAFRPSDITSWYRILNLMSYIVFVFDMLLSSRTGFYENGIVCLNGERIFSHWGKELVPSVLVVLSGFCLQLNGLEFFTFWGYLSSILFIFKWIDLKKIQEDLDEYLLIIGKYVQLTDLCTFLVKVLYIAHLFACAWYWIG